MPKLIARWNPARDAWETGTTGLFCEHSDVFSETWPSSGTTRAGTAYVQPTSAPLTDGSVSSSLLQTPSAADALGGHLSRGGERSTELLLPGQVAALLPTPVADHSRGLPQPGTDFASLPNVVLDLLPTPRATDGTKGGPNQRGSSGDLMLPSAVQLLPTPTTTQRGTDANLDTREGARTNLHNVVDALLPTPKATNNENRQSLDRYGMNLGQALGITALRPEANTNPETVAPPEQTQRQED